MRDFMNPAAEQRLRGYFDHIGDLLGDKRRRESFAVYAMGLLGEGERKSFEPIACRACPDPRKADAAHQRIQQFATDSPWSDERVRSAATQYALAPMTEREPIEVWITDDTGFLKQDPSTRPISDGCRRTGADLMHVAVRDARVIHFAPD